MPDWHAEQDEPERPDPVVVLDWSKESALAKFQRECSPALDRIGQLADRERPSLTPADPVATLRAAARRAAARTGLELVEAAKLSECHAALKAVVEG